MKQARKLARKVLSGLTALVVTAGSFVLAPAVLVSAAPGDAVNVLTVTLADGGAAADGAVQVSGVTDGGSPAAGKLYYVTALSGGAAPTQGAVIGSIAGAGPLVLNANIGSSMTADNWVRVYSADASGNITGYGAVKAAAQNIGTIMYTRSSAIVDGVTSSNTTTPPTVDPTWTDYTISAQLIMTSDASGTGQISLRFRRTAAGSSYSVYLTPTKSAGATDIDSYKVEFQGLLSAAPWASFYSSVVNTNTTPGSYTLGDVIGVKVVANGINFQVYAWNESKGGTCPATPVTITVSATDAAYSLTGNIGWNQGSGAVGRVDNIVVNRIAPPPVTGTPMTGVTIDNTAPKLNDVLTAAAAPSGATANYQWSTVDAVNGDVIVGTGASYTVKAADQGKAILVNAQGTGGYSGVVASALTAAVPGVSGTMETLTPVLDANAGAITDGAVKAESVAGATGKLYYSFGTTAGDAPAYGAPIGSVAGTAALSLGTEIGTGLDASYWLRVYDADASGNIIGFGSVQITFDKIGTLLYNQSADAKAPSGLYKGQSYYVGNATWTNYIITAKMTLNYTGAGLQLHFRRSGTSDYYFQMEGWGQMAFKGAGATLINGFGGGNTVGAPQYVKIVANGTKIDIYITKTLSGGNPVYPGTPSATVTDGDYVNGGVGWAVFAGTGASQTPQVYDGLFENVVVQRIRSADDPTGNVKPKITGASIRTLNAPATGNYPDSLFNFSQGSGSNQYTETIAWSPAITDVFKANTAYTATVTLTPGSYPGNLTTTTSTFQGVQLSDIGNLPASSAYSSMTASLSGDSMVITVVFKPTGATAVPASLLFSDDFTGTTLDPGKWNLAPSWDRQGNSTWNPGNNVDCATTNLVTLDNSGSAPLFDTGSSTVSNGNLVLKYQPNPAKTTAPQWIDCGAIRTRPRSNSNNLIFGNSYGYYEARIKPAKITGMWGAFWLMSPTQNQNPAAGVYGSEIDILETIANPTDGFNGAVYWNGYGMSAQNGMAASGSSGTGTKSPANIGINVYDGNYHTFGLAWSPTQYTWYVDGIPFASYPATPSSANICQNPDYIKLSLERATFSPPMDASYYVTGQTYVGMTIDWVRVWNQPPAAMSTNAADYVSMDLTPVYNASRDIWQIKAVLTNTQTAGSFSGTVSLQTPAGYTTQASQPYGPISPGASQTLLFDVSRTYASPGASDTATFQYTTDINKGTATKTVKLGSVSALKTAAPVVIDGNLNDAVWAGAVPIYFSKGVTAGTTATAAGRLAWDGNNLYAAVTVNSGAVYTAAALDLAAAGDSLHITVNGHAVDVDATGASPVGVASSAVLNAGGAIYEVAIPWSAVGVNGAAMANGDFSNLISFVINTGGGSISYFGPGADQGYLLLLDHVVYPKHVVTFNSNGGWAEPFQEIAEGALVAEPSPAPQKPYGYTFAGWYRDAALTSPWNFASDTVGTADITLYAKWNLSFTVTYNSNGGSGVPAVGNIAPGAAVSRPADPTRVGYVFAGWYSDNDLTKSWSFATAVNINMTLYAKWTLDTSYTDAGTAVKLSLAPYQDGAGAWHIAATLTNVSGAAVSGEIYETAPAAGSPVSYSLAAGASQKIDFPADPANLLAKYIFDFTTEPNGIGSASTQSILAAYTDGGIAVDGNLSDAGWQNAPVIDLGRATIYSDAVAVNQPVQNNLDVQANARMAWDAANLYVALDVVDEAHVQTAASAVDIWGQDSLQLRVKNASGAPAEVGFALNSATGNIMAYEWAGPSVGTLTASSYSAVIARDDATKMTRYEIAIPWATLGVDGASLNPGDTLPVCLALNDYGLLSTGARGRRQFEYFHGILATKDAGLGALALGGPTAPVLNGDATLAALGLSEGSLDPAFDPAVTEYSAVVPYDIDAVEIYATPAGANAQVSGAGVQALGVGENVFEITVTAENGDVKTYTLTVTRQIREELTCSVKSMAAKIGKPLQIPYTWDGAGSLTFTSSNAAVCGVSQSGVLSPLKAGVAVITIAAPNGDKVVFAVTVTA